MTPKQAPNSRKPDKRKPDSRKPGSRKQDRRGKVVLRMRGGAANPLIVEAALRMAQAFRGELHGLFVENKDLLALADLPFATEVSLTGHRSRALSLDLVRREMQAASDTMKREFDRLMQATHIPLHFDTVFEEAEDALDRILQETGILAIGEPFAWAGETHLQNLPAGVSGLIGMVLVGAQARRAKGAVLAIIDKDADTALLVDTAEHLAAGSGSPPGDPIVLLLAGSDTAENQHLEAQARKALDQGTRYRFETHIDPGAQEICAAARAANAGLVIARLGGPATQNEPAAARIACALDCPILLLSGG